MASQVFHELEEPEIPAPPGTPEVDGGQFREITSAIPIQGQRRRVPLGPQPEENQAHGRE